MSRRRSAGLAPLAAAGCAIALAAAGPARAGVPEGCPHQAPRPLRADALARAKATALREAPSLYRGEDLRGIRAVRAVRATQDRDRGGYAAKCGGRVRERSVVVYLEFPAEKPSSSLSTGVVLVARFAHGLRVWAVLH